MSLEYPYLEVQKPNGNEYVIWLKSIFEKKPQADRITIGRAEDNDIVLSDPNKQISRQHSALKQEVGRWWLIDEASANGTFLQKANEEEIDVRWDGKVALTDGDTFLILGNLSTNKEPIFWRFTFRDPGNTKQVLNYSPIGLEYNLTQEKLIRVIQNKRQEILLTPQENALISYMAQKNRDNGSKSVICRHQELIEAIWLDPFGCTKNAVTRLVWGLRNKIEVDPGEPKFLQTVRGQGYRLEIRMIN